MKTTAIRLFSLLTGIILFDYLFYKQEPGVNVLLFVLLILLLIKVSGRQLFQNRRQVLATLGWLVSGISVALYGSILSVLAFSGAALVFLGYSLEPELKAPPLSMIRSGLNFFAAPFTFGREIADSFMPKHHLLRLMRTLKLLIIPVILVITFIMIYRSANPLFDKTFDFIDIQFNRFIEWIEHYLSVAHLMFIIFSTVLFMGILYRSLNTLLVKLEANKPDELVRQKRSRQRYLITKARMTALKDEFRMGLFIFAMLNSVLLLANVTEILWLNSEYKKISAPIMSKNLHEGTWLLIVSIMLSMLVTLILFRKNLNFYSRNKWLVIGALTWIIQNLVLGINVALRNGYYISEYGLTYKRIGVFFCLLLVIIGLMFLWIKIRQKKSTWYLLRMNCWSIYIAFLLFSIINWDSIIITYNLRDNAPRIDPYNIIRLPDRNLRLLFLNHEKLNAADPASEPTIGSKLTEKAINFQERIRDKEWKSFNYMEWRAAKFLDASTQVEKQNQ